MFDKIMKDRIYQTLNEYSILTQAAQLNIAKGRTKYDDLVCHQASLDAQAAREILKAVNKLQIKTLEHWCFILRNNNFESSIKEMEQTLNQLKEYSETWNEERSENEN